MEKLPSNKEQEPIDSPESEVTQRTFLELATHDDGSGAIVELHSSKVVREIPLEQMMAAQTYVAMANKTLAEEIMPADRQDISIDGGWLHNFVWSNGL